MRGNHIFYLLNNKNNKIYFERMFFVSATDSDWQEVQPAAGGGPEEVPGEAERAVQDQQT